MGYLRRTLVHGLDRKFIWERNHYGQEDGFVKKALMMAPAIAGPFVLMALLLWKGAYR
jgi:hypothetical protein